MPDRYERFRRAALLILTAGVYNTADCNRQVGKALSRSVSMPANRENPMSFGPEEFPESYEPTAASGADRTLAPGIFLIIVGVLNFVIGGLLGFYGYMASQVPTEVLREQMERDRPQDLRELEKMGYTMRQIQDMIIYIFSSWGIIAIVLGLVVIVGGALMCARKGYTFAVIAAVLAAIPICSPSSCPCIIGMGIGIWALIVLFNDNVKAAFRSMNP
jgi:hypothetical protein